MENVLKNLGLTSNEIKIYLFLLKSGKTSTGLIIKETNIANSRVYQSLNSLIIKGLVNYTIEKTGKKFQAADPQVFIQIEEERKKKLESIIPDLEKIKQTKEENTSSAIYEGFEGFKTAFKKIIDDCPENETIYIWGFSDQELSNESLRIFLVNMNTKSAQKKQNLKILMDIEAKSSLGKDRLRETYSEVRYMPKGYISPASIDVFGEYVYIFLWGEKPFVFMIKNKLIAQSFKQYHSFLWNIAK
ncbi:MAG: helix-turn-helix domain-containing protein [Nanoarchaeota archaeon]|nr:helix-turn-helix domain-containing protein [Nanoarchaeota archaeon]